MTPDLKSILALASAAKEALEAYAVKYKGRATEDRLWLAYTRAMGALHSAMSPDVAIQLCERLERVEAAHAKTDAPDPYDFENQGLRKEP
jgi:hypothetical protein